MYEELADAFASQKSKVMIAKVDADAEKDLGSKFDIKGFPTLKAGSLLTSVVSCR